VAQPIREPNQSRNHHFNPRLILRGFAKGELLHVVDLSEGGRTFPRTIHDAAAENDYNSVRLEDGTVSDIAETAIADNVEGPVGELIARICSGGWLEDDELFLLSQFVTFQFFRVPRSRDVVNGVTDLVAKLNLAAKGPAGIEEGVAQLLGHPPTREEVLEYWNLLNTTGFRAEQVRETQIAHSFESLEQFAALPAMQYSWHVMRFEQRRLLTCDNPVVLRGDPERPSWSGVGLGTALNIYFSISRSCCLVLKNRSAEGGDIANGVELPGSTNFARAINTWTAWNATRWLYHHPDDELSELLGPDATLPPGRPRANFSSGQNMEIVERLKAASEYHYAHPDEPHPLKPRRKGRS
jgi:hypothetical protein